MLNHIVFSKLILWKIIMTGIKETGYYICENDGKEIILSLRIFGVKNV